MHLVLTLSDSWLSHCIPSCCFFSSTKHSASCMGRLPVRSHYFLIEGNYLACTAAKFSQFIWTSVCFASFFSASILTPQGLTKTWNDHDHPIQFSCHVNTFQHIGRPLDATGYFWSDQLSEPFGSALSLKANVKLSNHAITASSIS